MSSETVRSQWRYFRTWMKSSVSPGTKGRRDRQCGSIFVHSPRGLALWVVAILLLFFTACRPTQPVPQAGSDEWREFQGTWTAAGSRNTLPLIGNRSASISTFEGSLVLTGPSRPGVGFRSEAIVFNDSLTGLIGRAVWTDEKGDRAFSELRGEGTAQNNIITDNFIGGTGRYVGITGTYSFSWRFLIQSKDGVVQGQSVHLNGRFRLGTPQTSSNPASSSPGDPQS